MFCPVYGPMGYQYVGFAYDYMGRRIQKTYWTYPGSWVQQYSQLYVYDGWNPVAILNANNLALVD
jgi:hypothetical protein